RPVGASALVQRAGQLVEALGQVLDLEGQNDLEHTVEHGREADREHSSNQGQAGVAEEVEGNDDLEDARHEDQPPVRDDPTARDGAGDAHDAAEQQQPSDVGRNDQEGRIGPDPDRDADADLDEPEHDGPGAQRPVDWDAEAGEDPAQDQKRPDKDDEVAHGPA